MNTTHRYPQVRLDSLLDAEQLVAVQRILNAHQDPYQALPTLRAYLDGFAEPLREKGVLSDYLAFSIVHAVTTQEAKP